MKMREEGLTLDEIGVELGVSQSGVSKKLSRYRKLKALEESNQK
jgi:predicted transcriptional regulator